MRAGTVGRVVWVMAVLLAGGPVHAQLVGTSFTYQGRLTDGGNPASGAYDLQLALFDAASGGAQVGSTITRDDVAVSNGLFTVSLDFGAAFGGSRRWLELRVRPGASTGAYTTLAGRQELAPAPYAVFSTAAPWSGVSGKPAGFADDVDNDALGGLACPNGQIAKRVGGAWACADDADSGGDVTGVTAGSGLTGGGTSGAVTLSANLAGSGSANTIARSDHDHFSQSWSGSNATGLTVTNAGGAGVRAVGLSYGVLGEGSSSGSAGVQGIAPFVGVLGYASATDGYGGYFSNLGGGAALGVSGGGIAFSDGTVQTTAAVGDITGVTAGVGLTGGGSFGAPTLDVAFAGGGASNSVARADHDHLGASWSGNFGSAQAFRVVNTGTSGFSDGIWGQADAQTNGRGVVGYATSTAGTNFGIWGQSDSSVGRGVFGLANSASGSGVGVYGQTNAPFGYGVRGVSTGVAVGVTGVSDNNIGVWGQTQGSGPGGFGVLGTSFSTSGSGVRGRVSNGAGSGTTYAIYGEAPASPNGYAGYFDGRVQVVGLLAKGGGSFKIDHPLDPENKYLYHSFVESPDMMNVYNGNVTTGADGYATVELPDWFEALNRDFRYQLTVIDDGDAWVMAKVVREVRDNRFVLRTSVPGVKVSWQVTGIRKDPFAEANRIPVEQDKPADERGTYLHPREWGQPQEAGLDFKRRPPELPVAPH